MCKARPGFEITLALISFSLPCSLQKATTKRAPPRSATSKRSQMIPFRERKKKKTAAMARAMPPPPPPISGKASKVSSSIITTNNNNSNHHNSNNSNLRPDLRGRDTAAPTRASPA